MDQNKKWKINLSEPTVIFQGEEGDQGWGKHQFPELRYTTGGKIRARWSYGRDFAGTREKVYYYYLSEDGGKTWYEGNEEPKPLLKMPNGKYYINIKPYQAPYTKELELDRFTPAAEWMDGRSKLHFLDDVKDDELGKKYNVDGFTFLEYDPETGKTEEFEGKVNWPNAVLCSWHTGFTGNPAYMFDNCGANVIVNPDGSMFFTVYAIGLDATADREHAVFDGFAGEHTVYVFESHDCARTWNFVSQVHPDARIQAESKDFEDYKSEYEGFTEPRMHRLPNGDFIMLLRTGMSRTMYVTYSHDNCRTWTEPKVFDEFGVLPQMLTLDCGVTVTSYGRPNLRLRTSTDPKCEEWSEPTKIFVSDDEPNYRNRSCFYTSLLPVDDHTCLLMYMDFLYPNKNGVRVRSAIVRTLTVTEE